MAYTRHQVGYKFNSFTLIQHLGQLHTFGTDKTRSYWLCKCDCGREKRIEVSKINVTKSCGCTTKGGNKTHGESSKIKGKSVPEYKAWLHIKGRCYCKTNHKYQDYGARGIIVCDRWLNSYEDFLEDMGRRPDNKNSIDRIDNDGNYEPGNCRWADGYQQQRNTRRSCILEYKGESKTLIEWVQLLNLNYFAVLKRILYRGWSVVDAFDTPIRKK